VIDPQSQACIFYCLVPRHKNREIRSHVHYIYQMRVSHHHSNGKSNLPSFFFQFRRDLVKMSII